MYAFVAATTTTDRERGLAIKTTTTMGGVGITWGVVAFTVGTATSTGRGEILLFLVELVKVEELMLLLLVGMIQQENLILLLLEVLIGRETGANVVSSDGVIGARKGRSVPFTRPRLVRMKVLHTKSGFRILNVS